MPETDRELVDLFESLRSEDNLRSRFISIGQPETTYLEFKQKHDRRTPDLHTDDTDNFSKALSSFSNANGGLLIWGIETKRANGRDAASALKPIQQVEQLAERLRDYLLDGLMPQNPGVRIETIPDQSGEGYVKCLIPLSEYRPHRAQANKGYWLRLDGRSIQMEHYMIRDMMLRQASPDLTLTTLTRRQQASDPTDRRARVTVDVRLHNTGRAIARYAGWYTQIQNAKILTTERASDLSDYNNGRPTIAWDAPPGVVVHPNGIALGTARLHLEYVDPEKPIALLITYYSEGMAAKKTTFVLKFPAPEQSHYQIDVPSGDD